MPFPYRLDDEISAEREEFIHQNLQVPLSWIAKAKATRAAFEGRSGDQAWFLIRASEWNAAHEVVVKEIAPDAIIADNYEFFYELLKELEEASASLAGLQGERRSLRKLGRRMWDLSRERVLNRLGRR